MSCYFLKTAFCFKFFKHAFLLLTGLTVKNLDAFEVLQETFLKVRLDDTVLKFNAA